VFRRLRTTVSPTLFRRYSWSWWTFMNLWWISGDFVLLANCPRGAVCVGDLGFSRGEFPFKRRIRLRILSSYLIIFLVFSNSFPRAVGYCGEIVLVRFPRLNVLSRKFLLY
jgi:hypothetical protein